MTGVCYNDALKYSMMHDHFRCKVARWCMANNESSFASPLRFSFFSLVYSEASDCPEAMPVASEMIENVLFAFANKMAQSMGSPCLYNVSNGWLPCQQDACMISSFVYTGCLETNFNNFLLQQTSSCSVCSQSFQSLVSCQSRLSA